MRVLKHAPLLPAVFVLVYNERVERSSLSVSPSLSCVVSHSLPLPVVASCNFRRRRPVGGRCGYGLYAGVDPDADPDPGLTGHTVPCIPPVFLIGERAQR